MATQEQINSHDRLMQTLAVQFARGLRPILTRIFDELAAIPEPTRLQIQNLYNSARTYLDESLSNLDTVINSNLAMNGDVFDSTIPFQELRLREEVRAMVQAQIAEEQNNTISAVVMGAIAGVAIARTVRELRRGISKSLNRLLVAFNTAVRNYDGAFTLIKGRNQDTRWRYVGGTIPTSRDFCIRHNNKVYSRGEIEVIWRQSWGGKAPGDPFVVRGGYNCRHMFVPVKDEQ